MNPHLDEPAWLDARRSVCRDELSRMSGMSIAELEELVDYGALVPLPGQAEERRFSADCVIRLREAARLRGDFDLDLFTVGLLLGYMERIDHLERRLRALEAHMPAHLAARHEGPAPWHEPHA